MEGRPEIQPEPYYPPAYTPEPVQRRPWWKSAGAALGAAALLILKFGAKLKAILLLLPKLKLFTTSASMLVSIGAYTLIWGWKFAVGLAGPIIGSLGTCVPLAIWLATGEEFWQALAYVGFFINLFNLLPVLPLDGGRAMAALSPWVWAIGFAGLIALTIAFPNPIMILVLLFGGVESWRRWNARKTPESRAYHAIPARTRAIVAVVYLGLAVLLAVGVTETFLEKDFGDV